MRTFHYIGGEIDLKIEERRCPAALPYDVKCRGGEENTKIFVALLQVAVVEERARLFFFLVFARRCALVSRRVTTGLEVSV